MASLQRPIAVALLAAFACAFSLPCHSADQTLYRQIETLQRGAEDAEHSNDQLRALNQIQSALDIARELHPFDPLVSELRAQQAALQLAVRPYEIASRSIAKLIEDAPSIESHETGDADLIVELSTLHEKLLEYAIKKESVPAYQLDIDLCKSFRKCDFEPDRTMRMLSQFYIKRHQYAGLEKTAKEMLSWALRQAPKLLDPRRVLNSNYILFFAYKQQHKDKLAKETWEKEIAPRINGASNLIWLPVLAQAEEDALQYDLAMRDIDKAIAGIKVIEAHSQTPKQTLPDLQKLHESWSQLAGAYLFKASLASTMGKHEMAFDAAKQSRLYFDKLFLVARPDKTAKKAYRSVMTVQIESLKALGKTAEADALLREKTKMFFGFSF